MVLAFSFSASVIIAHGLRRRRGGGRSDCLAARPNEWFHAFRVHVFRLRYWHSHFLEVRYPTMSDDVVTPSGIPLAPVYGPADRAQDPPAPGEYPFTRGN